MKKFALIASVLGLSLSSVAFADAGFPSNHNAVVTNNSNQTVIAELLDKECNIKKVKTICRNGGVAVFEVSCKKPFTIGVCYQNGNFPNTVSGSGRPQQDCSGKPTSYCYNQKTVTVLGGPSDSQLPSNGAPVVQCGIR